MHRRPCAASSSLSVERAVMSQPGEIQTRTGAAAERSIRPSRAHWRGAAEAGEGAWRGGARACSVTLQSCACDSDEQGEGRGAGIRLWHVQ